MIWSSSDGDPPAAQPESALAATAAAPIEAKIRRFVAMGLILAPYILVWVARSSTCRLWLETFAELLWVLVLNRFRRIESPSCGTVKTAGVNQSSGHLVFGQRRALRADANLNRFGTTPVVTGTERNRGVRSASKSVSISRRCSA
ncbi:hypothetical protein GCM10023152_09000 [Agromyces bauzanensis]|uniref:Uncharacterized protein n=1 Tax=Agromyces bauzanensis TaxID=1308924 RepID=A0A917PL02_9MICO|nr:hypothetical protein GCM10011372_21970 [Agromyces bauzanensis]